MRVRTRHFDLPLRHTFTISRESINVQPTLIVELEEDGHHGYGEATTNRYYGVTIESLTAAVERVRPILEGITLTDPTQLWARIHQELEPGLAAGRSGEVEPGLAPVGSSGSFALCAIDQAAHDLWGKKRGQPVYRLWGLETSRLPVTNYTIGIDQIDLMVAKMREFPDWPVYKIKLGTSHDLEIVRALRAHTAATFRVDANCGWTAEETIRNARELAGLGVEFIEQPLPADQREAMRRVRAESVLPLIADESCIVESDVDPCRDGFHGINIKLVKCGGLTPARRMIQRARELGLKVMVGCMTESSVGISAIAQLLPLLDYVDMDGALLLARDIARGVTIEQGHCRYPRENGCGVQLIE